MRATAPLLLPCLCLCLCACDAAQVGAPPGPDDAVVWIDSGEIVHDKDYHELSSFVSPDAPVDWLSPIDYAHASFTMRVELLEVSDPAAAPIYYIVGWKPGNPAGSGAEYIRIALLLDEGPGVYEGTAPVQSAQRVVDGVDAGAIGDDWDWSNAFTDPNADAWDSNKEAELYPFKVRVTVTLHATEEGS